MNKAVALDVIKNTKVIIHMHDDIVNEINVFDEDDINIKEIEGLLSTYKEFVEKAFEFIDETVSVWEFEQYGGFKDRKEYFEYKEKLSKYTEKEKNND